MKRKTNRKKRRVRHSKHTNRKTNTNPSTVTEHRSGSHTETPMVLDYSYIGVSRRYIGTLILVWVVATVSTLYLITVN